MKIFLHKFFLLLINLFWCVISYSQTEVNDSATKTVQLDLKDIIHKILNSKDHKDSGEVKTFQVSVLPGLGYSPNTSLYLAVAGNALFNLKGSEKKSYITSSLRYTFFNQSIFPVNMNLWTKDDKFNIEFESYYLNYPSDLYGLIKPSDLNKSYPVNFKNIRLRPVISLKTSTNLYLGIGVYYDYIWGIVEDRKNFSDLYPSNYNTAFEFYSGQKTPATHESAVGPAVRMLFNSRDNPINPSVGALISVTYHRVFKRGNGVPGWDELVIDARKYFSFSENRQSILALRGYYRKTFGNPPFLFLPSIGWDKDWTTGRGYPQGRYRGKEMRYAEAEYRFQITNNGLIGGVLFGNLQNFPGELFTSFSEFNGTRSANVTKAGGGFGLRLKFDKLSKTNIDFDFGFGQQFPKLWFFLNLGELF